MTFPLDPGMWAFLAKEVEHVPLPDTPAQSVPPEGFQAEDAEHAVVTPSRPSDNGRLNPADERHPSRPAELE